MREFNSASSVVNVKSSTVVIENSESEPACWQIRSVFIGPGVKVGIETLRFFGNFLNSIFPPLYWKTLKISFESNNFRISAVFCEILEIVHAISSLCLFRAARYLESISQRSDRLFIIQSILLWKSSSCLLIIGIHINFLKRDMIFYFFEYFEKKCSF